MSGVHGDKERDLGSASGCSQCVCLVGRKEVLITQEFVAELYLPGQQVRSVYEAIWVALGADWGIPASCQGEASTPTPTSCCPAGQVGL